MTTIFDLIANECERQDRRWGAHQSHPVGIWLLIFMEEIGEVAQAFLQCRVNDACAELVQVAAVCVAWLEDVINRDGDQDGLIADIEKKLVAANDAAT